MYLAEQRIAFQMKAYEWIMVTEALDAYIEKFGDLADVDELIMFADHIESKIKIGNYQE